jgi:hypothetical protein
MLFNFLVSVLDTANILELTISYSIIFQQEKPNENTAHKKKFFLNKRHH